MTDEEALAECQKEIRRLRTVIRILEEENESLRKQCNTLGGGCKEEPK